MRTTLLRLGQFRIKRVFKAQAELPGAGAANPAQWPGHDTTCGSKPLTKKQLDSLELGHSQFCNYSGSVSQLWAPGVFPAGALELLPGGDEKLPAAVFR
jgi:hypothetical protein